MSQAPIVEKTPDASVPEIDPDEPEQDESRFPLPSISTRQLLLLAAILALALLVWRAKRAGETDEEGRELVEDDSIEGIYVPENPDDPLRADSAVITGLKEAGVMG